MPFRVLPTGFPARLALIIAVALLLRLAWAWLNYSPDLMRLQDGDYVSYIVSARDFALYGNFTNSTFLVRPPLFAVMMVLLGQNQLLILLANCLLGALTAACTAWFARQLGLSEALALLAALIVALDPLSVDYSAFLGPEPIANLSILWVTMAAWAMLQAQRGWAAALWGIVAGLALLISTYTRPAAYLMWIPVLLWLILAAWRAWRAPRLWVGAALFVGLTFAGVQVYVQHNAAVHGNPTFSTVSAFTMAYYRAASVLSIATELDARQAEDAITRRVLELTGGDPTQALDSSSRWSFHAASPEVEAALNQASWEVFRAHPLTYLVTLPLGLVRMYDLVPRIPPLERLWTFWWHYPVLLWHWVFLVSGLAGAWLAYRQRNWGLLWVYLLLMGYFTAGTLYAKSAGMEGRERTMLTPYMALASAYAFYHFFMTWRLQRASRQAKSA